MHFASLFTIVTGLTIAAASSIDPATSTASLAKTKRCHEHKHKHPEIKPSTKKCHNTTSTSSPSSPYTDPNQPIAPIEPIPEPTEPVQPTPTTPIPPPSPTTPATPVIPVTPVTPNPDPSTGHQGDLNPGTTLATNPTNDTSTGTRTDTTGWHKATTTLYYDNSGGACGCYDPQTHAMLDWQKGNDGFITAAGSAGIYGSDGTKGWCGSGCGKCYKLVSTGSAPCDTCGYGTNGEKTEINIMVTNLCPNSGNENWCVAPGLKNKQGYEHHFDLMAPNFRINGKVWDNPVVYYKEIDCPTDHYSTCVCKGQAPQV